MSELIYGLHAVSAVLEQAPDRAKCLWLLTSRDDAKARSLLALAKAADIPVKRLSRDAFSKELPDAPVHQGVALAVKSALSLSENDLCDHIELALERSERISILALDGVQDPRNLGACLRSAAAFGVTAVVIPKRRCASLTASAEKVACGGAAFVPVVMVTNLARTLKALQELGLWVVGTAADAKDDLSQIDMTGNTVIVMGSEGDGIRQLTEKGCDYLAKIPMMGTLPSLNVSAAATVCLYEQERQRSVK